MTTPDLDALALAFESSQLSVVSTDHEISEDGAAHVFFRDSSLRARVSLRVRLDGVPSKTTVRSLGVVDDDGRLVSFECDVDDRDTVSVEGVRVLARTEDVLPDDADDRALTFSLEVILRATGARSSDPPSSVVRAELVVAPVLSAPRPSRARRPLRAASVVVPLAASRPVALTVRSVGAARAAAGATLVSLTVAHSNAHPFDVTVTNVALHPRHSRIADEDEDEDERGVRRVDGVHPRSAPVGDAASSSRGVRWGYVAGTAPSFPLVLKPHEAVSIVLQIDASGPDRRNLTCPLAVAAAVGQERDLCATVDARYTTDRAVGGLEPSDAFRVDMDLRGTRCRVGAPLVVSLRVHNLSNEDRDMMLLMAKDESADSSSSLSSGGGGARRKQPISRKDSYVRSGALQHYTSSVVQDSNGGDDDDDDDEPPDAPVATPRQSNVRGADDNDGHNFHNANSVNTAVVSEVNGYTFGVWGLAGNDDGTTRHNRDHELLAVDAALLLGEVKGQHSIDAELRFVPLREGTLDVPNLKLYDKLGGRWYNCVHRLKIVATASD